MNARVIESLKKLKNMPVHVSNKVCYMINISTPLGQYYKLDKMWERCCQDAGISKIRWHDLRHTFASRLVMGGENILTVQTMRYAHLAPQHLQRAVDSLVNWSGIAPERAPSIEGSSSK